MSAYAVVGDDLYQSQWTELTEVPIPSNIDNTRRETKRSRLFPIPATQLYDFLYPKKLSSATYKVES